MDKKDIRDEAEAYVKDTGIEERIERLEKEVTVGRPHRQQLAILKADVDVLWNRMSDRSAMNDQLKNAMESNKAQMLSLESLMDKLIKFDDITNKKIGNVIYD